MLDFQRYFAGERWPPPLRWRRPAKSTSGRHVGIASRHWWHLPRRLRIREGHGGLERIRIVLYHRNKHGLLRLLTVAVATDMNDCDIYCWTMVFCTRVQNLPLEICPGEHFVAHGWSILLLGTTAQYLIHHDSDGLREHLYTIVTAPDAERGPLQTDGAAPVARRQGPSFAHHNSGFR
jgi:hypothetical protein